jgi:hypothetical protein
MANFNTERNGQAIPENTIKNGTPQITSPTPMKREDSFMQSTPTSPETQRPAFPRWDTLRIKVIERPREEEENSQLTDYTYVYDDPTTTDENEFKNLNEQTLNEQDLNQDKDPWTIPPQNEQARHNRMHFTACYDDDCWAHRQAKEGANYFPQKPNHRRERKTAHGKRPHSTNWQKCYNDHCSTHLEEKRATGVYPRRNGKHKQIRPHGTEEDKEGGEKHETTEERDRRISQAIDQEEIIRLHNEKEEWRTKAEEWEEKAKDMEEAKNQAEKEEGEMRRAWRWEESMKKVLGQDAMKLRIALDEEREEHKKKEEALRNAILQMGVEVLKIRNMGNILCERIAAGEFNGL